MDEFAYKINIRIKNTKPVKLENLTTFFEGIENEYKSNLGKKFHLNMPDCETNLALAEVKPGSQIFTIVALVAADCLLPHLNQQVLVSFFDYITALLDDFADENNSNRVEQHSKKECQNVQDIAKLYQHDFGLEIEMNVCDNQSVIKSVTVSKHKGVQIYKQATNQIQKLNSIKNNAFTGKLLYFYQTQNSQQSKGDKVIISSFSDKAKKIEFATPALKQEVIGMEENFYKHIYRASGYINYQNDKIKSYTVTEIEKTEGNDAI